MTVKKRNNERLFWILQIVGWFTFGVVTFSNIGQFSIAYLLYSYFGYSVLGIALTSAFRWYLKRYVEIDWYGKNDIFELMIALVICISAFFLSSYLLEYVYDRIWTRTDFEIDYLEKFGGFANNLVGSVVIVIGWTSIYYGIKIYLQRGVHQAEQLELSSTLREAQLNTLKGQVNPHFMFNSLNNIRGLMLEDVEKSRSMITKLSEMLEFALEKNTVDAIPLSQELEMVRNYIALSKIQMEERLKYIEDIDQDAINIPIPPMIIQLLVENAAKHGIANLKQGGTITLTINKNSTELFITVSNTGKLHIAKDSTQLGLKNIRQRLRLLYGDKASFSLEEVHEEVVASLKIPLI